MRRTIVTSALLLAALPQFAFALGYEEFTLNGLDRNGRVVVMEPFVDYPPLRTKGEDSPIVGATIAGFSYHIGKQSKHLPVHCTLMFGKSMVCARNAPGAAKFSYTGTQITDQMLRPLGGDAQKLMQGEFHELYQKWSRTSDCKTVDSVYACTKDCDSELPAKLLLNWCGD
jgi:hypothetical protein